jgi:hypothetical protein
MLESLQRCEHAGRKNIAQQQEGAISFSPMTWSSTIAKSRQAYERAAGLGHTGVLSLAAG